MIKVFDFFSGCGGTSRGFQNAGLGIAFGLDNDKDSIASFATNFPRAKVFDDDIRKLNAKTISKIIDLSSNSPSLFAGCAPCQPFTKLNTSHPKVDPRISLLDLFGEQVEMFEPEYIFIENVPGIQNGKKGNGPISAFIKRLKRMEYFFDSGVVLAQDYGVPQRRRRFVLVASRLSTIKIPQKTHGIEEGLIPHTTVRDYILSLPEIGAGEVSDYHELHRAAALSELNLKRIKATPVGGGRLDWGDDLVLNCHNGGHKGHTDVYGRMRWDEQAPALTTRCISLSNGRFGHPTQNRAISLLEAARLQTFPDNHVFVGQNGSRARQIGNAVPTQLAEVFGKMFINHYKTVQEKSIATHV